MYPRHAWRSELWRSELSLLKPSDIRSLDLKKKLYTAHILGNKLYCGAAPPTKCAAPQYLHNDY